MAHSDIFGVYVLIFEMNTEYIAIFSFFLKKKKKKKKKKLVILITYDVTL